MLRQLSLKADLHGTIFAYDYRVRIAYVMTYDHPHRHTQFSLRTSAMCRTNVIGSNRPLTSSPGPLYQNEVKRSAFDVEMIFHSKCKQNSFSKRKVYALDLILKVRVFGTWKWLIYTTRSVVKS